MKENQKYDASYYIKKHITKEVIAAIKREILHACIANGYIKTIEKNQQVPRET